MAPILAANLAAVNDQEPLEIDNRDFLSRAGFPVVKERADNHECVALFDSVMDFFARRGFYPHWTDRAGSVIVERKVAVIAIEKAGVRWPERE